jgi:hypothetical protein
VVAAETVVAEGEGEGEKHCRTGRCLVAFSDKAATNGHNKAVVQAGAVCRPGTDQAPHTPQTGCWPAQRFSYFFFIFFSVIFFFLRFLKADSFLSDFLKSGILNISFF